MFVKVLLLVYASVSNAVFIDTLEHHNKDLVKTSPQIWQMVKVHHPPQAFGYRYEPYAYPKYEFEYSVSDKKTGDHKHHHEARDGDRVRGEYSLVETDGSLRKVQYHADDHSGFKAVVSKTINKHSDNAVSVSDHTRFFYPVGHNININHYFPLNDYHYKAIEKPEEISKPVHEKPVVVTDKDIKMVLIDSADKLMAVEPVQFDEDIKDTSTTEKASTVKSDAAEAMPVQLIPTVVSVIPNSNENMKSIESTSSMSLVQKADHLPANERTEKEIPLKEQAKEDSSDSEVASSYYQSKFYYIIQ